jgi:predicted nucleic acid-binding protein
MPFVLDASIAACWAFGDEEHAIADRAQARLGDDEAHAPALWWFEIRNALIAGERRGRIGEAEAAAFLQYLGRLPVRLDREPVEADLLSLARRHKLTVYDAAYLELAMRLASPIATLDRRLSAASEAESLALV